MRFGHWYFVLTSQDSVKVPKVCKLTNKIYRFYKTLGTSIFYSLRIGRARGGGLLWGKALENFIYQTTISCPTSMISLDSKKKYFSNNDIITLALSLKYFQRRAKRGEYHFPVKLKWVYATPSNVQPPSPVYAPDVKDLHHQIKHKGKLKSHKPKNYYQSKDGYRFLRLLRGIQYKPHFI